MGPEGDPILSYYIETFVASLGSDSDFILQSADGDCVASSVNVHVIVDAAP